MDLCSPARHIEDAPVHNRFLAVSKSIKDILGDNASTLAKAQQLQAAGFYALPIRPPTVPANTARIRLVMNAKLTDEDCEQLIRQL